MVTHRQTDRHTDRQTDMQHTEPAQYTVLGWLKMTEIEIMDTVTEANEQFDVILYPEKEEKI